MEKQKILYQQARLHARGAAEMVLQMISASKGNNRLINCSKMTFSSNMLSPVCIIFNPAKEAVICFILTMCLTVLQLAFSYFIRGCSFH